MRSTKCALARSIVFASTLAYSALAFASGGSHNADLDPHINWWRWDMNAPPVGWFMVNFVIFVALLSKLAGKKVAASFQQRATSIGQQVETNARELQAASDTRNEWKNKRMSVEQEATELVENSKADGERQRGNIVKAAEDYAERLRSDTQVIMEQEAATAQRDLQREVSLQALDKAEAALRSSITDQDRARLFDQAVNELADGSQPVSVSVGQAAYSGDAA